MIDKGVKISNIRRSLIEIAPEGMEFQWRSHVTQRGKDVKD